MSYKLFFSSLMVVSLAMTQTPWAGGRGGKDDDVDKCNQDAKLALKKKTEEDEGIIATQIGLEKSYGTPPKVDETVVPDDIDLSETVLTHGDDEDWTALEKKDDHTPENDEDTSHLKEDTPFQFEEDIQEIEIALTPTPAFTKRSDASPKIKRRRLIRVTPTPESHTGPRPYPHLPLHPARRTYTPYSKRAANGLSIDKPLLTCTLPEESAPALPVIETFITGKYAPLAHMPGVTSLLPKTPQDTLPAPSDSDEDLDREALNVLFGDAPLPGGTNEATDPAESLFEATAQAISRHFEDDTSQEDESDDTQSSDNDDGAPLIKRRLDSPYPQESADDSEAETSSGATTSDSESEEDSSDVSSWDEADDDSAESITVKSDSDADQSPWDDIFIHPTSDTRVHAPSQEMPLQVQLQRATQSIVRGFLRTPLLEGVLSLSALPRLPVSALFKTIAHTSGASALDSSHSYTNLWINERRNGFFTGTPEPQKPVATHNMPSSFGDGISLRPHYGKTTAPKITITLPVKKTPTAKADFSKRVHSFKDIAWPETGFLRDLAFANREKVPLFADCYYKVHLGNKTKTLSGKELHTLGRKTCRHLHLEAVYDGLTPLWTGRAPASQTSTHAFSLQHPVLKHFFSEVLENLHQTRRVAVITPDAFLSLLPGARVAYDSTTPRGFALARKNHAAVNFLAYVKSHAGHDVDVAWVKHKKTVVYKAS